MARPLIIGEQPPYGAVIANHSPMFPVPERSAGGRLCALYGSRASYLADFDRLNLVPWPSKTWPKEQAMWAACSLLRGGNLMTRPAILLGAKVRDAFVRDVMDVEWGKWYRTKSCPRFVCLPHPSGRSRLWDADMRERAREVLQEAVRFAAQ